MKMRACVVAVALCVIVSTPLSGQLQVSETIHSIARPENAPKTIGDLIGRMRAGVDSSVISVDWSTDAFIIPVAGNAAGGNGTYFRSDVAFNNDGLESQRIAVGWFQAGQNNCLEPLQFFTLSPNSVTFADDFVGQSLRKSGLGAILVVAVTSDGALDEEGQIDGYSRIWTPQPGTTGTVSQNFSAIDVQDSIGSLTATLMGMKQNAQFRTNVGIVNLDTEASHSWTFTSVFNGRTTTFTVPPCSMIQTAAAANSASANGNLAFTVQSDGFGFWWSGWGSSTDNVTGDGWIARAIQ